MPDRASAGRAAAEIPDSELAWHLRIDLSVRRSLGDPDGTVLERWAADLVLEDEEDGEPLTTIGSAHLVRCQLGVPGMAMRLDDETVDLGIVGAAVLDHRGEPAPALGDLGGIGDRLLILDYVVLEPAWRGRGIGRWFAAELLETLSPGALFAATMASPISDTEDDGETDRGEALARRRAELKLRKTWADIGFEQVSGSIMVLDLGLVALGERLAVLRTVFGA